MKSLYEDYRIEKKWIFLKRDKISLLNILQKKGFFFRKCFPNRKINNIYYDTSSLKSLRDNLSGIKSREKLRVRWYGNFFSTNKLCIERKIKNNQIGFKKRDKINFQLNLDDYSSIKKLNHYISSKYFLMNQKVFPILYNSYERIYTSSKIFPDIRCTLDFNLKSFIFNETSLPKNLKLHSHLILEIKYPFKKDDLVKKMINQYNLKRISKSSKYVSMYASHKFV